MKHLFCALCALSLFGHLSFNLAAFAQEPNWNQFRGPNSDNHSFSTGIAKSWPEGGPRLLWQVDHIGVGFSNLSFYGNRIYTMGDIDGRCYALALDRATGAIIWRTHIGRGGGNHVGPRATPAVDGESVFVIGQHGDFVALNASDGTVRWRKNLRNDFNSNIAGGWGFAMSPIFDGDKILVPVGGADGALIAFDKAGNVIWRSTGFTDQIGYNSVVVATIEGVRQYLLKTMSSIAGISPADGSVLWRADFPSIIAVCSCPVAYGNVVIASCAYGTGTYFYRITREGNNFRATQFNRHVEPPILESHHGGMVAVNGYFYFMAGGRHPGRETMVCLDAQTGNIVWEHPGIGKGSLTYVDGMLILRHEGGGELNGTIALIEATPAGYREHGRFEQPNRTDISSWTYPVVVDRRLYIRDQNLLFVYDLSAQ